MPGVDQYGQKSNPLRSTFRLRVIPDNQGPEFESQLSLWGSDAGRLQPGRWTYVRYHPDKPDRCELDKDRLTSEFDPLYNGKQRVMVPKDVSGGWFSQAEPA